MNAVSQPPPAATAEAPLSRAEKEKLLKQMYSAAHWIELIRLFGYQTIPMDKARQAIKPLAEKFGKEPLANACEVLVEISTPNKEPVARLKPHIRRMAFQILGPEPTVETAEPITTATKPSAAPINEDQPKRAPRKRVRTVAPSEPAEAVSTTPDTRSALMQQYQAAKEKHPNMLLLFRMGDFYELFGPDAETAHKLLGLTLTMRDRTMSMAGFPHHQLETYLHKLLQQGQRVVICEPVEESLARGPIRREVTRVVTPGAEADESEPAKTDSDDGPPVRQPRHLVLKKCEDWFKESGLAFVAMEEVRRTTPAVAPYIGTLDFVVLRGDDKLLVTVRPHLQVKHLSALRGLTELYGPEFKPVRMWPVEGPDRWIWRDFPVEVPATAPAPMSKQKQKHKRPHARKSA